MTCRVLILCAVLAGAVPFAGAAVQSDAAKSPFNIVAASGTIVRVDLGARRERASELRRATVLTPAGAVRANVVRAERVCEWLCGTGNEDGKECHYEAVLRAHARVTEAVAVLPGSPAVHDVSPFARGVERPVDDADRWIQSEPVGQRADDRTYRWTRFADGVFLTSQDLGRDFYAPPIELHSCAIRLAAPFTIVSCPTAELLYEGLRGIAVSFADYGEDTVEPELRFSLDGREAVVIRLGLKTRVVSALLIRRDDGRWQLLYREPDYAQLC